MSKQQLRPQWTTLEQAILESHGSHSNCQTLLFLHFPHLLPFTAAHVDCFKPASWRHLLYIFFADVTCSVIHRHLKVLQQGFSEEGDHSHHKFGLDDCQDYAVGLQNILLVTEQ